MKKLIGPFPIGVWIALIAIFLQFVAWGMQAFSLMDWDRAVDLGLQNDRFTGDVAEHARALESWGVAVTDMIWALPIGIIALVGIPNKKFYGYSAGIMELAIGVYWPLVFAFQRWNMFHETAIMAIILWVPISILGIIGLWYNRMIFVRHT